MSRGGKRPGAGRPKGSKDSVPRVRRADILNKRREDWDKWATSTHAMRRARNVLLAIMEDAEVPARDRIKAAQLIEERGLGRPTEEHEQPTPQPLMIMLPQQGGGYQRLDNVRTIEVEATAMQPEGDLD